VVIVLKNENRNIILLRTFITSLDFKSFIFDFEFYDLFLVFSFISEFFYCEEKVCFGLKFNRVKSLKDVLE